MGLEVELELQLELGLPAATRVDVREAGHKSFIKPVHNHDSSLHKSVRKTIMTAVSVLRTSNYERNMNDNNSKQHNSRARVAL